VQVRCQLCQGLGHVACSGDDEAGFRTQDFKEDLQRRATTADRFSLIGIQVNVCEIGMSFTDGMQRGLCNLAIGAWSSKAPRRATIGMYEHLAADPHGAAPMVLTTVATAMRSLCRNAACISW